MDILGSLLLLALDIYMWIIIAEVVISWLIIFDVINVRNAKAQSLISLIKRLTDPVMKPIRNFVPPVAGLDLSPIIVIFGIMLAQQLVVGIFYG